MKKKLLKSLLIIPALVWAGLVLRNAVDFSGITDTAYSLFLMASGLALGLASLAVCFIKQTRWMGVASLLIFGITAYGESALRSHLLATGVQQLEVVYREIAASGPPFPDSIDRASYENPVYLPWYYQKNSEQSFAIVYLDSSDGWAMEYPYAKWQWIGYRPDGYELFETRSVSKPFPTAEPQR